LTTQPPSQRLVSSPLFIAAIAFAIRGIAVYFSWRRGFEGGPYGFEAGRIAESIVLGHGFSSPLATVQTGPTAWLCPVFPWMMALVFRVWGIFTFQSLVVIQVMNCLFAALTIFPVHAVARKSFGPGIADPAAWLWTFLPSAIHTPVADIWDTSLTALLLALIFWATLAVREKQGLPAWSGYGALWALAALTNAAVISIVPFFFGWLLWNRSKARARSTRLVAAGFFVFLMLVLPWTIRNHRVLGSWIPLRSNFGLELWLGNNPEGNEVNSFALHPFVNVSEGQRFKQLGEIAYMNVKRDEAIVFIRSHPLFAMRLLLRRIGLFWFAVSDRPRLEWSALPLYVKVLLVPNFALILLSWVGAYLAFQSHKPQAFLFGVTLLMFPVPYYITHALSRYRFPIEPILTVLCVYGLACALPPLGWLAGQPVRGEVLRSPMHLWKERFK
jgi:4-amino-4-deoxy-L-arabinose transferase-like glycosyltransferase